MAVTSDGTPYVEPGDAISAYPVVSQELAAVIDSLRLIIPVGTIAPYAGKTTAGAPEGWLPCDGKAYARTDFFDLYGVMSEWLPEWGGWPSGNSARFYVPDMRGRSPIGIASGFATVSSDPAPTDEPVADVGLGERVGDWRVGEHHHSLVATDANTTPRSSVGAQAGSDIEGTVGNGPKPFFTSNAGWGTGYPFKLMAFGQAHNYQPSTGVNFIVYTGTTTTGKSSTGEQLPRVTTRMMIEKRLDAAGIGEEQIAELREMLATLKEDTDG